MDCCFAPEAILRFWQSRSPREFGRRPQDVGPQVICKPLHKLRLEEIETEHVIAVLRKVWHQREISRDTRQRIKKILDAAIALNLRPKHNPADWDSRLKPIMPKQRKRGTVRGSYKAMDYHDLPAFMQKLAADSDQSARALEVTILTIRANHRSAEHTLVAARSRNRTLGFGHT